MSRAIAVHVECRFLSRVEGNMSRIEGKKNVTLDPRQNPPLVHVRYKSLCISLPSFAKQQREMISSALSEERELRRLIYCGVPDSVS